MYNNTDEHDNKVLKVMEKIKKGSYITIDNKIERDVEEYYDELYDIFYNDKIPKDIQQLDPILIYYIGMKYEIDKNYNEMKYHYLIAISKGNVDAMDCIGLYYYYIENNEELMKYYYDMAIDNGSIDSYINYATYYIVIDEYEEAKRYYLMAIEKGDIDAMLRLAYYY